MKVYLRDLAFSSAREVEVTTNKKAIIIMVRFPPHSPQAARPSCAAGSRICPKIFVLVLLRFFFLGLTWRCACPRRCRTGCCRSTTRDC